MREQAATPSARMSTRPTPTGVVNRAAAWHVDTRNERATPPTPRRRAAADRPRYFHEVELNFG